MQILVVTPYYKPDGGPAAPLFTMLCEELVRLGHRVDVITAVPHYPSGNVPTEYRGYKTHTTNENGVHVSRVPLPSMDRSKLSWRMVQALFFQVRSVLSGVKKNYDILLTHSPGLELWFPFWVYSTLEEETCGLFSS